MDNSNNRPSYEPQAPVDPPSEVTPRLGSLQRLLNAFSSPGKVFEDIRVKPTWVLALVGMMILTVGAQTIVLPHLDQETTIRQRMASRSDELSEEQIDQVVERAEKFTRFMPVITAVVVPIMWALLAAIFFLMLKLVGSEADYQRTLSTALHAYWPPAVVASVLMVALIQRAGKVTEDEIPNLMKSHIGAFLSPDAPSWLSSVATTLSVFNVWTVVLLVIGFKIVGRLSTARATTAVLVPWVVWLIGKAGLGLLQGMLS
jgi:hypothetical protein